VSGERVGESYRVDNNCGLGLLLCKRWDSQAITDFALAVLLYYSGSGG